MRILLTRAETDTQAVAQALAGQGIGTLSVPVIKIIACPGAEVALDDIHAIAVTSRHGIGMLARHTHRRDLPVFAVGPATAAAAARHGFASVLTGMGGVDGLALLLRTKLPRGSRILHAAGAHRAGDLASKLAADGLFVEVATLYEAVAIAELPEDILHQLRTNPPEVAGFFSARTAAIFRSLVRHSGLDDFCRGTTALCLSQQVASVAQTLPWGAIRIADAPTTDAFVCCAAKIAREFMSLT